MSHHRNYETATSMHQFVQNFKNDLRSNAPASDVRVFKMINGKQVLVAVEPPITYDEALKITNEHYSRKNGERGQ